MQSEMGNDGRPRPRRLSYSSTSRHFDLDSTKSAPSTASSSEAVWGNVSWPRRTAIEVISMEPSTSSDIFNELRKSRERAEWKSPSIPDVGEDNGDTEDNHTTAEGQEDESVEDAADETGMASFPPIRYDGKKPQSIIRSDGFSGGPKWEAGCRVVSFESLAASDIQAVRDTLPSEIQLDLPEQNVEMEQKLKTLIDNAAALVEEDLTVDKQTRTDLQLWIRFGNEILKSPIPSDTLQLTLTGLALSMRALRKMNLPEGKIDLLTTEQIDDLLKRTRWMLGSKDCDDRMRRHLKRSMERVQDPARRADDPLLPSLQLLWKRTMRDAELTVRDKERERDARREKEQRLSEARSSRAVWRRDPFEYSSSARRYGR